MNLPMQVFITLVAAITAIIILTTKIIELKSAFIKYRAEKTTPKSDSNTANEAQKTSKRDVWRSVEAFTQMLCGFWFILVLFTAKGPMTPQHIAIGSLAVILFVSGISINQRNGA